MNDITIILITLILLWIIIFVANLVWKLIFLYFVKQHRKEQTQEIRFLQVKIPKWAVWKSSDIEATDHIKDMKNNIEIMNQVYKNFYSIFEDSWKYKKFWNNYISMEMFVEKEQIKFFLGVPKEHIETVEKMISAFYSSAVVEPVNQPKLLEAWKYMAWWEFTLNKHSVHPLKTYESFEADPMDSILSAYNKVEKDEKMILQILIEPLHEDWLKKLRSKAENIKNGKDFWPIQKIWKKIWKTNSSKENDEKKNEDKHKHDFSQAQLSDFDKKMDDEVFGVKIRTFATSPQKEKPKKILEDLSRLFNQYNYVGLNTLKFKPAKNIREFAQDIALRNFHTNKWLFSELAEIKKNTILNIKELSSIIHFPHARFNLNPRLVWQKYKIVPAPDNMSTDGMLLWWNLYGGVKREVRLSDKDRFRHVYILGQTGTGKSTMILTQIREDLKKGNGFCVIDPHGDLCEYALKYFPKDKIDDLVYFDLANTDYPIAFNPLDGATNDDERDVITNDLVEMFVNMYGHEIFWPRIQDYFRNACFLLMEQPEWWTLIDIMRLFTDDAFAESKIRNVKNPIIAAWRNKTYRKMWDREKAEIIPFIQAKFGPFTTGVYVRNVIGQLKSSFNFYDAMQEWKIILCNLSKGLTGEMNSQLIGRMIAMQIKLSALKRAKIPEEDRKPYYLYVDEFQNYVSQSFESILSEARKYKLGLTIAHQYIDQLKKEWLWGQLDLAKTIFGNIGTMFILKVGSNDAEFLEKEFGPEFSQSDLQASEIFKWVMKMSIEGTQSRPFSLSAKVPYGDPALNQNEKIQIIKQISALKWWTKRDLVDKEIYFRVWV